MKAPFCNPCLKAWKDYAEGPGFTRTNDRQKAYRPGSHEGVVLQSERTRGAERVRFLVK